LKNFIGQPNRMSFTLESTLELIPIDVAIKTADGITSFGVVVSVDDCEISVHVADKLKVDTGDSI